MRFLSIPSQSYYRPISDETRTMKVLRRLRPVLTGAGVMYHQGMALDSLARTYYGTETKWYSIADKNAIQLVGWKCDPTKLRTIIT